MDRATDQDKKTTPESTLPKPFCWMVVIMLALGGCVFLWDGINAAIAGEDLKETVKPIVGALVMFGLILAGVFGYRWFEAAAEYKREMQNQYPDQPWRWEKKWADGKVTSSNKAWAIGSCFFAAIFSLVGWPTFFMSYQNIVKGDYALLLTLVFPLIGLMTGYHAIRCCLAYRKFGESSFQMACMPGLIGGELAGVVHTKAAGLPEDGFQLTLKSVKATTTGSGKQRSTKYEILWEDCQTVNVNLGSEGDVVLPVSFAIPFESHDCSTEQTENPRYTWSLSVAAKYPGSDFNCEFDVPVFRTSESRKDFVATRQVEQEFSSPVSVERLCAASGVRKSTRNGEITFAFPWARQFGKKFMLLFALLFVFGADYAFVINAAEFGSMRFVVYAFAAFFGFIGLVLAATTFRAWTHFGEISADPTGVRIKSGFLGLKNRTRTADQIKAVIYKEIMNNQHQEFNLFIETTVDKRPLLFGPGLRGETAARTLCEDIAIAIGKPGIGKIEKVKPNNQILERLEKELGAGDRMPKPSA